MEYLDLYVGVLKKYTAFSGRAGRKEFWVFFLINYVITIILNSLGSTSGPRIVFLILLIIYALGTLIPNLALWFRRLHDRDLSAWNLLYGLIPLAGVIILIVMAAKAGTPGDNKYGASPTA